MFDLVSSGILLALFSHLQFCKFNARLNAAVQKPLGGVQRATKRLHSAVGSGQQGSMPGSKERRQSTGEGEIHTRTRSEPNSRNRLTTPPARSRRGLVTCETGKSIRPPFPQQNNPSPPKLFSFSDTKTLVETLSQNGLSQMATDHIEQLCAALK